MQTGIMTTCGHCGASYDTDDGHNCPKFPRKRPRHTGGGGGGYGRTRRCRRCTR